ncbi:CYTOSINE-SPECIFIC METHYLTRANSFERASE [Salix koriyanagi]|uniref:DNA (cytosine-5-)-methyltransferase n=1 Tax=Salix koriyanagi TaxID=2511006 RepID=A0A9Q0QA75_9ROSI|nr:CYTOSINE-SPECIFIC METHYLTRANSFERASE [Salix koriyanagi]
MPRKRQRSAASKPETLSSSPPKTRKMMPKATLATAPKQSRLKEKKTEEEQPKRATRSPLKEKKAEEGQSTAPKRSRLREKNLEKEEPVEVFLDAEEDDTNSVDEVGAKMGTDNGVCRSNTREKGKEKRGSGKTKKISTLEKAREEDETPARFVGNQIPNAEARKNWPHRYANKINNKTSTSKSPNSLDDSEEIIKARCHYKRALVDGIIYNLYDDAHVQASDGEADYICRIIEMFESEDKTPHFTAQWYYRSTDTIIKDKYITDPKCVFYSEIRNDNPLECLTRKLKIVRLALSVDSETRRAKTLNCDFYCDMLYLLPYSTFVKLPSENNTTAPESSSTISSDIDAAGVKYECDEVSETSGRRKSEVALLDLYSGCGAMSTGLCLGANLSGLNLVTKWAVDLNKHACESLRLNHSETQVRNESAEDFLMLLKEWEKLCIRFSLVKNDDPEKQQPYCFDMDDEDEDDDGGDDDSGDEDDSEVFEVEKILEVCYGDPKEIGGQRDLYFKVSWKNYGPNYDTWEPISGMSNCREVIKKFVMNGYKSNMLPLPGDVEVICGGPPCQGISGFNRFRNVKNPLEDPKNKQLVVFMDIVDFLKPKFVLMENVVDLLKFADGFLGRYAVGCLVSMKYQARLGMLAAGAYGLPQFRMRVFLWGACATEKLPQYPLPTHDVLVRGVVPLEFEGNTVAYEEGVKPELERKLFLQDAISDLPAVANDEKRNEMPYGESPKTEFQRMIRLKKMGLKLNDLLFDHRPLELNEDDYQRVCRIPKKKGGNFRDLPGVRVRPDKKVEWDPEVPRQYLSSGKPLVPDYAMTFVNGSSSKPFARLWWDETVPTVVTRAEPHNQAIMHPEQDRVLTIRENARLQGFPDYYQLCGPIKERYIQVGNAVAVPVARALGYALGRAFQGLAGDDPVFNLPKKFPRITEDPSSSSEAHC